jgi:hypothetical protein
MYPPLEVHSNAAPMPNARWNKEVLSATEIEGILPFLTQIRAKKDQGLSGVGVVASFIRRRVQPLKERVHYGFEYTKYQDPTPVTPDELSEDEVLERLQDVLGVVSVIPYQFPECDHDHPPHAISIPDQL